DIERASRLFAEHGYEFIFLAVRIGRPADQVRRFRRETEVPIVIISNSSNEDVLCQALDAGADWVLTRPYSTRLLIMQLRALLRRTKDTAFLRLPILSVGQVRLDPSTRTVAVGQRPSRRLTPLEFRLLYTLMIHRGQTVPTPTLIERVWGYEGEGSMELARGLVSRLRAKIEENPKSPRYILTVPGIGYMLTNPEE
ncbi:MAG: response regulator transcription factor, partial [Chloroflexi bacterium]|nr:response regulator transcription factor [Chloroflexota bacterium]